MAGATEEEETGAQEDQVGAQEDQEDLEAQEDQDAVGQTSISPSTKK